jgi:hypothetical protein
LGSRISFAGLISSSAGRSATARSKHWPRTVSTLSTNLIEIIDPVIGRPTLFSRSFFSMPVTQSSST